MKEYEFEPAAAQELEEAVDCYNARQKDTGRQERGHQMPIDLSQVSFDEFRDFLFVGRNQSEPQHRWVREGNRERILLHCIRLFRSAADLPRVFTRVQLVDGFDFVSGWEGFFPLPADPMVTMSVRQEFYTSMFELFTQLFSADPLGHNCFMWFERMVVWNCLDDVHRTYEDPALRRAMLDAERKVLTLEADHCRMAALHGLNHLYDDDPQSVEFIIDEFLERSSVTPEVRGYALSCRRGLQP